MSELLINAVRNGAHLDNGLLVISQSAHFFANRRTFKCSISRWRRVTGKVRDNSVGETDA
jgi:hypothetical protein